jgi:hypothetical protein
MIMLYPFLFWITRPSNFMRAGLGWMDGVGIIICIRDWVIMDIAPEIGYVQYLQNLLKTHSIEFKAEEVFEKERRVEKQFVKGPLDTNLEFPLCGDVLARYSRQMLLKEIGYEGQLKVCRARVAVVGAGGIGCPLGLYLAGAGVGVLGFFDGDVVELNNLHRQVGHTTSSLGRPKTESLAATLRSLNPNI